MQADLNATYRWDGKNYGPGMTEIPDSLAVAIGLNLPPPQQEPPPNSLQSLEDLSKNPPSKQPPPAEETPPSKRKAMQ